MNKTSIEWVKNPDGTQGYTWNPITGCLNGCEYCYARRLANTRLKERYLANKNIAYPVTPTSLIGSPFYPRFWPERLKELACFSAINEPNYLKRLPRKERGIFVCDMSDLFGIGVPESWTRDILDTISHASMHRFYLLTKQPQNLVKFSPFPDNCWVGVSTTNWLAFSDALGILSTLQAKVTYLSFEPLLERIQFDMMQEMLFPKAVDWVIIGAQTKPTVMPKIEWVREIVEACDKASIPVFLKDNLRPLIPDFIKAVASVDSALIGKPCEYLRQEMPTIR